MGQEIEALFWWILYDIQIGYLFAIRMALHCRMYSFEVPRRSWQCSFQHCGQHTDHSTLSRIYGIIGGMCVCVCVRERERDREREREDWVNVCESLISNATGDIKSWFRNRLCIWTSNWRTPLQGLNFQYLSLNWVLYYFFLLSYLKAGGYRLPFFSVGGLYFVFAVPAFFILLTSPRKYYIL